MRHNAVTAITTFLPIMRVPEGDQAVAGNHDAGRRL